MQNYVLGFVFNHLEQVLLMTKDHPPNQVGKLNGIGGKVKQFTLPEGCYQQEGWEAAMEREASEEVETATTLQWSLCGQFGGEAFNVNVFATRYRLNISAKETETVDWYPVSRLPENCMYNVNYLIPLCYDIVMRRGGTQFFNVMER